MMLESIEKLREYVRNTKTVFSEPLAEIADEIEREIAERYMKVPVDADGVPIHVGDKVKCKFNDDVREVGYVGKCGFHEETHHYFDAENFTHVKPDPVKELLEEYYSKRSDDALDESACSGLHREEAIKCVRRDVAALIDEYAARIREAVEK